MGQLSKENPMNILLDTMAHRGVRNLLPHLPPLPSLRELMAIQKISAIKRLSQNFLMDMNLTNKIVRHAKHIKGAYVCEVGPGPGGITRSILNKNPKELYVIEKDRRFLPCLQDLADATDNKLNIFIGDILRFDMSDVFPEETLRLWDEHCPDIHIIGNLPFNISTPLIIKWLKDISTHSGAWRYGRVRLTLTFQEEVAQRLIAEAEGVHRSRLSIQAQYLCHVQHRFLIPGSAFVPAPDVDVGVVTFTPRRVPLINQPFAIVEKVVSHIFHHRQKNIKYGFRTLMPFDRPDLVNYIMAETNLAHDNKPVKLTMDDFGNICNVYAQMCQDITGLFEYTYDSHDTVEAMKKWRKARKEGASVFLKQDNYTPNNDIYDTCSHSDGIPVT